MTTTLSTIEPTSTRIADDLLRGLNMIEAAMERKSQTHRRDTFAPSRIELCHAGGTVPSCDRVLLAFAMTLAQRHDWTMVRLCEFLARPWGYQREWNEWIQEQREAEVTRGE